MDLKVSPKGSRWRKIAVNTKNLVSTSKRVMREEDPPRPKENLRGRAKMRQTYINAIVF
jgi:hypothetical protein